MRFTRVIVLLSLCTLAAAPQQQKRDRRLSNEMGSPYRLWVEQDVAYIITDEEKQAFHRLSNDD